MALSDLTSAQLQKILQLLKERETLQNRLSLIDHSLSALNGGSSKQPSGLVKTGRRRRKRRGAMKEEILKALSSAGKNGVAVRDLAVQLGAKRTSVAVWFYLNAKKIKGLKKVGPARFAYSE